MTTEEIEIAAGFRWALDAPYARRGDIVDTFKAGVEYANRYWRRKMEWRSFKEELPLFDGKKRAIIVKREDNLSFAIRWIIQEIALSDFEYLPYTHWREIEL